MSRKSFANVWDAIEETPAAAANMKLRSSLMIALQSHIQSEKLSQAEAARVLGITQPRVSDLMRGKITLFSLNTLVDLLSAAGLHLEVRIVKAASQTQR